MFDLCGYSSTDGAAGTTAIVDHELRTKS
jgi:hypothetical protein